MLVSAGFFHVNPDRRKKTYQEQADAKRDVVVPVLVHMLAKAGRGVDDGGAVACGLRAPSPSGFLVEVGVGTVSLSFMLGLV